MQMLNPLEDRAQEAPAKCLSLDGTAAKQRPGPTRIYVVSDSQGFVGAFLSRTEAYAAMKPHVLSPFLIHAYGAAPGPLDSVWIVLYRANDAVAFVSNDRSVAASAQKKYAAVGLAYEDDIDYWEQPVGAICKSAAARLETVSRAHELLAADCVESAIEERNAADEALLDRLTRPIPGGPIERLLRETERITIMDQVVETRCIPSREEICAGTGEEAS
jgi:hypothetical protein